MGAGSSAGNGDSPVPEEVWEVRGADRSNGVIAAAGPVPAGTTVHFWVRDDPGRHLRRALIGRSADTALAFVADPVRRGYDPMSRDPAARGAADHDAAILAEQLRIDAVTGMVASTQIGPVKGALRALDADVSVALLTDR